MDLTIINILKNLSYLKAIQTSELVQKLILAS